MTADFIRTRKLLAGSDFKTLFIEELGWNHHYARLEIPLDGLTVTLSAVAEKCGMAAFVCTPGADGRILDSAMRRKIERQVTKRAHEHLIIFIDGKRTAQVWQWVRREQGKPAACREHAYHAGQPGDSLIQKLQALSVSLEEEECLTLTAVTGRARRAFDIERVTKKFYDRFKTEHATFLHFIEGIPDEEMERWYVSVMLNRLMFIYFIQKKGFLNDDTDYLKNKLSQCRKEIGKDRYYRDFLCPLFFEGFAKRKEERSEKSRKLLGEVPYLNGGIFNPHQIEQLHGKTITIPDKAFEKLFEFFDAYHWHLDERPLKRDDEINPDVLGYIFEKYVNQKQMGAYYTKEDITEYIGKNTVIPLLFEKGKERYKLAFEGPQSVWWLLRDNPDRYIYSAIQHGITVNIHENSLKLIEGPLSLPPEIRIGLHDASKRDDWNKVAPSEYALPTETWREVIARQKRYEEVRNKLAAGEVSSINDFITYNLDIRQFAQDVIENAEAPEIIRAFWRVLSEITVLDPACGSGAFLFAALNILEPLYEACLARMRCFVDELDHSSQKHDPKKYADFREVLKRAAEHPKERYFILKSIVVNNLYGVDIMEEAVEICKLRLFLKLVAQIEHVEDLEPLPDIDFNIRAGNTLVGFVSIDEVRQAATRDFVGQGKLVFGETEKVLHRIEEEANLADRAFQMFRRMQTDLGMEPADFAEAKEDLRSRLKKLTGELDRFLAGEYGVETKKKGAFEKWHKGHQPFHWFAEFYGILKAGGFDVIIGNPPYVEYSKIRPEYQIREYVTETCGNLYAFMFERSFSVRSHRSVIGKIVPLSVMATERMAPLQRLLIRPNDEVWLSAFDVYPSKLFDGSKQRLAIVLHSTTKSLAGEVWSTRYNRWRPEERKHLFGLLKYNKTKYEPSLGVIPKIGDPISSGILNKLRGERVAQFRRETSAPSFYVHRIPYNYVKAIDFIPHFWNQIDGTKKSEDYKPYYLPKDADAKVALAVLNSNLFFFWWYTLFEGYHCGRHEIEAFPFGLERMSPSLKRLLAELAIELMKDLKAKKNRKECIYKNTGQVVYDEFYPRLSKQIIDEIDNVLAEHYRFSSYEIDFIVNFDVKYRGSEDRNDELPMDAGNDF